VSDHARGRIIGELIILASVLFSMWAMREASKPVPVVPVPIVSPDCSGAYPIVAPRLHDTTLGQEVDIGGFTYVVIQIKDEKTVILAPKECVHTGPR